jgi:ubiquinone/menaquinone biosynthesis C-methylase UbiE
MVDTTPDPKLDPNFAIYNARAVTEYYAAMDGLTPCEQLLFDTYLKPGMAILDLGVGGGRTTRFLSSIAAGYVGLDYAPEMIAVCRSKFPHLIFETGNAADLSRFAAASFDAVVMAFNGIDYLFPDESRSRMLGEACRVLKPEGMLIFSAHNPRSIFVRPSWNRERVRSFAEKITGNSIWPGASFRVLTMLRRILALLQSGWRTLARVVQRVPTEAFWHGEGYWIDPAHGGLTTHFATPKAVIREASRFGFQLLRVLGDDYPRTSGVMVTDWFYYVFSKAQATQER